MKSIEKSNKNGNNSCPRSAFSLHLAVVDAFTVPKLNKLALAKKLKGYRETATQTKLQEKSQILRAIQLLKIIRWNLLTAHTKIIKNVNSNHPETCRFRIQSRARAKY